MDFTAMYEVVLINGKKYWFCSNECQNRKVEDGIRYCLYFDKELTSDKDNCKPCNECLECFNKTKNI